MNRRVISAFLLIVMLISLFPVQAFAADAAENNSAVLSDVENGETTPSEDEVPNEEVDIPPIPEAEYEEVTEEPTEETNVEPTEKPKCSNEAKGETGKDETEGTEETAEKFSVRFNLTPADLTLKVYASDSQPISPEADGSYLLLPGAYYYDAECEGYISALGIPFTIAGSATIDIVLEQDSASSSPTPSPNVAESPEVAEEEEFAAIFEDNTGSGFEFALTGKTDNTYKAGETLSFGFTDSANNADKALYENFTWTVTMKNADVTVSLFVGANEDNSLFTLYSDETKTTPAVATGDAHIVLTGKTQKPEQRTEYNVTKLGSGNNEEALIELPSETVEPGESYKFKVRTHDMTETQLQVSVTMGGNPLELDGVNLSRTVAEDELGVYYEYTVLKATGDIVVEAKSTLPVQCRVKFADAYNSNTTLKYSAFDYISAVVSNYSSQTHIGEVAYNGKGLTFTILNRPLYKKSDGTFNVDGSSPDPNTGSYNYDVTATMGGKTVTVTQYNGLYLVNNGGKITGDVLIKTNLTLSSYECAVNGAEKVTITNRETFINSSGKTAYTGRRSDRPKYRYLFTVTANPAQTQKIYIRQYSGTTTTKRTFTISDSKTTAMVYGDLVKGNIAVTALGANEVEVYVTGSNAANVNFDSVLHNYSFYHGGIAKKGADFTFTVSPATKITIKSGTNTFTLGKQYTAAYDEAVGAYVYKILAAYMTADIQIGAVSTAVASGTCGDNLMWTLDESGVLTISGNGEMNYESWWSYQPWENYRDRIKTVVIEPGVTSIFSYAFSGCNSLISVTIPDSVENIGDHAFYGCSSLKTVTIPNSVTDIGEYAFQSCSSLKSVTLPGSVTSIGNYAFSGCSSLKSIIVSAENECYSSINGVLFNKNATTLIMCPKAYKGSYIIPNRVKIISAGAFSGCDCLTSVTIPDGVTSIGAEAFNYCGSLTSVTIPDSVTSIGGYAFNCCGKLTRVTIPDGVTNIAYRAFSQCRSLASITIPNSVMTIDDSAFWECTSLTKITIPDSVTYIDNYAFLGCDSLTTVAIPDSVTSIGSQAFDYCYKLASVTIGSGITYIGGGIFSNCHGLTSVTISESVVSIGAGTFEYCRNLKNVYYSGSKEQWDEISIASGNEYLTKAKLHCAKTPISSGKCGINLTYTLNSDGTLTISGFGDMADYSTGAPAPWNAFKTKIKTVIIESDVTSIGSFAFSGCSNLTSLTIPDNVEYIGDSAFSGCVAVTDLTIGSGVTNIGSYAFQACKNLASVVIPDGVTNIGKGAFSGCSSLVDLTIPDGIEVINERTFFDCGSLASITIPDSVSEIGSEAFSGCCALVSVAIPDGVTSIGKGAFSGCRGLISVTMPENITVINDKTFYNCANLSDISMPGNITRIGSSAFYGCSALTAVDVPDGVTVIGNKAFSNCGSLESITIPESVETIDSEAFFGCISLEYIEVCSEYYLSIDGVLFNSSATELIWFSPAYNGSYTIPDGVEKICANAFYNCTGLTDITIPCTVTCIDTNAFSGCISLTDVYFVGVIEQWSTVNISSGNDCFTQTDIHCVDLKLTLDREYITMSLDDEPVNLMATVTPTEWESLLTWNAENPKDKDGNEIEVISVNDGVIMANAIGTAYVVAEVKFKDYSITARCRVDVTDNPTAAEITGVQLGATSVTTELYSKNYTEFDIVLLLERSWAQSTSADNSTSTVNADKPEDNGVAIKSAEFEDLTVKDLFDLVVVDDRRLAVVPKIKVKDDDDSSEVKIDISAFKKSSYSSKVNVYVGDNEEPYTTETALKLTVKKSTPKLKATVAAFNSFYSDQSNTIEITGATVTEIKPDTTKKLAVPTWLNLSESGDGVLSIAENAIQKSASGSVYLKVYTEEWVVPASVTLSVKNTYKAPKLKLSSSSVKFSAISSMGVGMDLMSATKNEYIWDYNITDLTASDGFIVEGFDFEHYGTNFTLKAPAGDLPGKITLYAHFSDTDNTVPITLSVSKVSPAIKLGTSNVTLNPKYDDSTAVYVIPNPSNYNGEVIVSVTDAKNNSTDELKAWYEYEGNEYYNNSKLYVQTNDSTKYNTAYKVTVSIPNTKSKAVLTVKTCKENVKPTLTLKSSGAIDLTYGYSSLTINTVFKNYSGDFEFLGGTVTETKGKTKIGDGDISKYFTAELDGKYIYLRKAEKAKLTAGNTYAAALKFKVGDETISANAKITVKQTAVTVKLPKTALTLNKLTGDSAVITITTNPKYYSLGKPVIKIMDKTGKKSADGKLDVSYSYGWDGATYGDKLTVAVNDRTVCGETYKVLVSAGEGYKATTLTVTIPTEAKSKVSATLKAKGSIDTIRDDTKIVFTPTYKNTVSTPTKETIEVYSSDGKKVYEVDGLELANFDAVSTTKYKAKVVAAFENGQTVSSPLVSITVKTGTAKMKATGTPTLYLKDRNSRGKFTLTSDDLTLNAIKDIEDGGIEIKDTKYRDMFELYDYGNGQYAIGFKDNKVSEAAAKLKSASIPLNIWHDGNNTAKPDATVTLKVTLVK